MDAHRRYVHKWFTQATGIAKSEMRKRIMTPKSVKKENELEKAVNDWIREVEILEELENNAQVMPDAYKVTALKCIFANISST